MKFLLSDSRFKSKSKPFHFFLGEVNNAASIKINILKFCYSSELIDFIATSKVIIALCF